eukprot:6964428-Pyramimonas_sp.AAC.1
MVAMTTARPVTAPMLITPTTMTASPVGDEGVGRISTCARGRRARVARARKGTPMISACGAGG